MPLNNFKQRFRRTKLKHIQLFSHDICFEEIFTKQIIGHFIIHTSQRLIMLATLATADTPLFSKSRLSAEFHWPAPTRPWSPTARSGLNITDAGLGRSCVVFMNRLFLFQPIDWSRALAGSCIVTASGQPEVSLIVMDVFRWSPASSDHKVCPSC